jgi:ureidoglycolate lyase
MDLIAEPLTAEAFAPYGDVLEAPTAPGRRYVGDGLANRRAGAATSLSIATIAPTDAGALRTDMLERHVFSSQTFLPLSVSRYLVIVAPDAAGGGPDGTQARAFVARAGQGITYHAGTWHHGMTVLDQPAQFAVLMWRAGTSDDEEFVPLGATLTVTVPASL